jgi:hypothetical protein
VEVVAKGFYGLVLAGYVTLGDQRSGIAPVAPKEPTPREDASLAQEEAMPLAPTPTLNLDPRHAPKLRAFAQRLAAVARDVLPEAQWEAVARREAEALQRLEDGAGSDALKALALDLSRGAVEAGCPAERVHLLNTRLKALFSPR